MKIVKINGGLGNQMFQYAFGLVLEKHYNETIYYDISNYNLKDENTFRPFLLNKYNTNVKIADKRQRKKCTNENSKLKNNINKIFKKEIFVENSNRIVEKTPTLYDDSIFKNSKDIYFEGFFQTEKYFKHIRPVVLKNLTLKEGLNTENKKILEEINAQNSISLHIRRGDFLVLTEVFYNYGKEYYEKAINYITEKIDSPYFYIFSNDREWVKENFHIKYPMKIVDINEDKNSYYDIELMRNCKHNIICNSTFSWWGAWLNENPNKIVIAPSAWYKNIKNYDIIPKEWLQVGKDII